MSGDTEIQHATADSEPTRRHRVTLTSIDAEKLSLVKSIDRVLDVADQRPKYPTFNSAV